MKKNTIRTNEQPTAAAVNYPDLLMLCNGYQFKPKVPYNPGSEACGTILRLGKGVGTLFQTGDKVIVGSRIGMMRSILDVPVESMIPLPNRLNFEQGACFSVAFSTAYHCLIERARLKQSDVILINGASGGVGSAALQIARRVVGCKTVIATGTSHRKLSKLHDATHTIDFESVSLRRNVFSPEPETPPPPRHHLRNKTKIFRHPKNCEDSSGFVEFWTKIIAATQPIF